MTGGKKSCQKILRSLISIVRKTNHALNNVPVTVPKIINLCFRSFIAAGCSKEPGQTHRGDRGTKSCLSHWPPGCLLANLIMLEANCDHPSIIALTITSHMALGAEVRSLLFFFYQAGSWFTFRLVLGKLKSFWVEALRHWPF